MGRYLTPHLARELTQAYNFSIARRDPVAARRVLNVDRELAAGSLIKAYVHRNNALVYEMVRRMQVLDLKEAVRLGLEHAQKEKAQGGLK